MQNFSNSYTNELAKTRRGRTFLSFADTIANNIRPFGEAIGQSIRLANPRTQQGFQMAATKPLELQAQAYKTNDPKERQRLLQEANFFRNSVDFGKGPAVQGDLSRRNVATSAFKTGAYALTPSISGLNLGATAGLSALLGGGNEYNTGKNFADTLPFVALSQNITSPLISKFTPTTGKLSSGITGRTTQGLFNVGEGVGLNIGTGTKNNALGVGFDFLTGFAGMPFKSDLNAPVGKSFDVGRNTRTKWAKQDIDLLDSLRDVFNANRRKLNKTDINNIDDQVSRLARGYLPNDQIEKIVSKYGSNSKGAIKEMLDVLAKTATKAQDAGRVIDDNKFTLDQIKMGLVGDSASKKTKLEVGGGKFGTERFNVNQTIDNTIRDTAKRLEPEIAIKRGGTKSFEQTLNDAKKISLDDLLSGKGNQPADARVFAASAYIKDLSETIDSIRAKGPGVLPKDRAVLENAQENLDKLIIKTFGELSPESGRALKAHQYLAEVITDPQLKLKNFVARNTELYPNTEKVVAGLNQFKPEDRIGMIKYLRDAQKVDNVSKLESIWYNNILSGTSTHLANLVGNLGRTMWHLSTKPVRVGVDTLGSAVTGQPRQEFLKETMPELVGATKGFRDGVRRAVFAFKNGLRESDVAELNVPKSAFKGKLQAIETPGRLLLAGDELFRGINRNMDIYRQAASTAAQEGLKGDAYNIRVAELIDSPTSDMIKKADDIAIKLLFQDASKELSAVGGLRDFAQFDVAKLGTVRPMRFVIPFIQTPVNVAKFAVEASPLGLAQTALGAKNLTKQELNRQLASNLMGTAMTAALATYFVEGKLTARAPSGKDGDAFYEEGKLPYAVKVGDTWVQYNRLPEPLASQLTNLALLHEQFKEDPDADIAQKVTSYTSGFIRSMADRTFLSGIGDLMDAIEDPERYGKRFTQNLATGFIPGSSLVGSVARATDRTVRSPENISQALQSRVPVLSRNVPARASDIAPSGEAVRRSPAFQEFLPIKTSKETQLSPEQFTSLSSKGIVERLPNLDVNQRIEVLASIKRDNPTLYSNVKRKLLDKQQGVTKDEVKLRNSSVSNRARTIKSDLKGKSKEEILERLREYKEKGILTDSVLNELKKTSINGS